MGTARLLCRFRAYLWSWSRSVLVVGMAEHHAWQHACRWVMLQPLVKGPKNLHQRIYTGLRVLAWCLQWPGANYIASVIKTRFLFFLGVNGLCFASLTMCNSTCTCSCRSITQTAQVSRRTAHWTLKFCESASSAGVGLCQAKVWSSTPLSLTTKTQFFQSELPVTSVFCMG